jgi:NAD(P)-dependent dehydrogenase (short-subunit alcohol dehydrogenase family)
MRHNRDDSVTARSRPPAGPFWPARLARTAAATRQCGAGAHGTSRRRCDRRGRFAGNRRAGPPGFPMPPALIGSWRRGAVICRPRRSAGLGGVLGGPAEVTDHGDFRRIAGAPLVRHGWINAVVNNAAAAPYSRPGRLDSAAFARRLRTRTSLGSG